MSVELEFTKIYKKLEFTIIIKDNFLTALYIAASPIHIHTLTKPIDYNYLLAIIRDLL